MSAVTEAPRRHDARVRRRVSANDVRARVGEILDGLVGPGRESGLQVAAYLDGELLVDAHADWAERPGGPAYLLSDLPAFGHHGSCGSIAFADRERGLAFALIRTRLVSLRPDTAARLPADEIRAAVRTVR